MKIFTSYWANVKNLSDTIQAIGISLYSPRWQSGVISYKKLAPDKSLLNLIKNDAITPAEYDKRFAKILDDLSPHIVFRELEKLSGGKDIALLCYEKPPEHCHRHLVAKWFKDKLGIDVVELPYKK